jgi:hypothetical protein
MGSSCLRSPRSGRTSECFCHALLMFGEYDTNVIVTEFMHSLSMLQVLMVPVLQRVTRLKIS